MANTAVTVALAAENLPAADAAVPAAAVPAVPAVPDVPDVPAVAKKDTDGVIEYYNKNLKNIQNSATIKNEYFDTVDGTIELAELTKLQKAEKTIGMHYTNPNKVQFISLDSIEENDIPTKWSIVNAASFIPRRFKIVNKKKDFSISGKMHQGISFGLGSIGTSNFKDIIDRLKNDEFINVGENDNIAYFMSRHNVPNSNSKYTYIIWQLLIRYPIKGRRDEPSTEEKSDDCYVASPLYYSNTGDDRFFVLKNTKKVFFTAQDLLMCIFLEMHTSEINSGGRKSRRSKRTRKSKSKSKRLGKTRRRR